MEPISKTLRFLDMVQKYRESLLQSRARHFPHESVTGSIEMVSEAEAIVRIFSVDQNVIPADTKELDVSLTRFETIATYRIRSR